MSAPIEMVAFHVAFVVRDVEAAIERYRRMFALEYWRQMEFGSLIVAYGGRAGGGATIELMQPLAVTDEISGNLVKFLDDHGEGVEHIGFWTPDVRSALQAAIDGGAKLLRENYELRDSTVFRLEAPADPHLAKFSNIGHVYDGVTPVRWEFIGPPTDDALKGWLQESYDAIISPPPWA